MATAKGKSNNRQGRGSSRQSKAQRHNDFMNGIGYMELMSFITGLLITVFAVLMFVSFFSFLFTGDADFSLAERGADLMNEERKYKNACGSWGANIAFYFINDLFGLASFAIPVYMIFVGFRMMKIIHFTLVRKFIVMSFGMLGVSIILATFDDLFLNGGSFLRLGGNHGQTAVNYLTGAMGRPGLFAFLIVYAILYLVYISSRTVEVVKDIIRLRFIKKERLKAMLHRNNNNTTNDDKTDDEVTQSIDRNGITDKSDTESVNTIEDTKPLTLEFEFDNTDIANSNDNEPLPFDSEKNEATTPADVADTEMEMTTGVTELGDGDIERGNINTPYDPKLDLELYKYPELSLLSHSINQTPQIDIDEQRANKDRIIHVLKNFGVDIVHIKATIGPTVTLYEIVPAEGTRISKIRNLEDDIALSLAAKGIRIIAPIPGKGTIGIEVPNNNPCIVPMESVLSSRVYQESTMELPCAIGKTISNEVFMFDLTKAPHLLVAGATGMGKSVGLNAIVTSLLYKKHPAELKIVIIDPKKVEFSIYSPIENHFLARLEEEDDCIITDVHKVVKTLNSLCQLMDSRYDLLQKAGVRNIKEYNEKFKKRVLNPEHGHEFMPYIVVIVDEFGDLIMTSGKEVELPICRIAQLARAVGIHMIIATQRPQASIISGAIKANFPARIAFKVGSMMDSRVILDRPGAQQLVGKGDMLFLSGAEPVRVQCAFVDTPEVSDICHYISRQQSYLHPLFLPEVADAEAEGGVMGGIDKGRLDPMFADVAKFVVVHDSGSTSMIQRNFSIGYNRAGKIMDQLEKMGVVGPQSGAKPREVLIKDPLTLEGLLNSIG